MKNIRRLLILAVAIAVLVACSCVVIFKGGSAETIPTLKEGDVLSWRYMDNPRDLDAIQDLSWTQPGYDDSHWASGSGTFGARDGQRKSVENMDAPDICLRQYLPNGENMPVYFFRLTFASEELARPLYKATVLYDDAITVYLNGQPIFQGNVPADGFTDLHAYGVDEARSVILQEDVLLEASLLRRGENVLAVELHQEDPDSSDIYFSMSPFSSAIEESDEMRRDSLCLGVGEERDQLFITWQGIGDVGRVELTSGLKHERDFPDDPIVFDADLIYSNSWDANTFRAVVTGLQPGQTYTYRVVDTAPSNVYAFTMPEAGDFCFIVNGDPQIEEADETKPIEIYDALISAATGEDAPAFLLSLGDQSDEADDEELFLRYLSSRSVKSLPVAAIVGNHEDHSDYFSRFFSLPHVDKASIDHSGDMSGDYWFGHEGLLVLCLNSNNGHIDEHAKALHAFKEAYIERYGEPKWIIAALHHSLYSVGSHADADNILEDRKDYSPLLEDLGVDVVFGAHDHRYVRTYPMNGETIIDDASSHLVDPEGIVYLTLGTSTGTKIYDDESDRYDYDLVVDHEGLPAVTRVDVSETELIITTYAKTDDDSIEVIDTVTLEKTKA